MIESLKDKLTWYEDRIPESLSLLHDCIGKRISRIACHHLPGEDGRLFDTIEINVGGEPIYLRAPRTEEMARCFPSFKHFPVIEFVSRSPPVKDWNAHDGYQQVTHRDNEEWETLIGKQIDRLDLLIKLSPPEIQGIRMILDDDSVMNYHFAWGDAPGDLVSARIGLVIGGLVVPKNIQWTYVPWLWNSEVTVDAHAGNGG